MHLFYIIACGLWVQVSIFSTYSFIADFLHPENEGLGKISQKYLVATCISLVNLLGTYLTQNSTGHKYQKMSVREGVTPSNWVEATGYYST
jgi:hypothetical protein